VRVSMNSAFKCPTIAFPSEQSVVARGGLQSLKPSRKARGIGVKVLGVPLPLCTRDIGVISDGRPHLFIPASGYCPNLCLYSIEEMKALTISALMKLPPN
jgi:hypothetical protein